MSAGRRKTERNSARLAKRKRVNRLKTIIVIGAVLLICTSVILNIVLVFKVLHIENQIDELYSQTPVMVTQNNVYLN